MKFRIIPLLILIVLSCSSPKVITKPIAELYSSAEAVEMGINFYVNGTNDLPGFTESEDVLFILSTFIPFSDSNLAFTRISGEELISDPDYIDDAYLFSKFANRLFYYKDYRIEYSGQQLADWYIKSVEKLPANPQPTTTLKFNISSPLNSATFDDEFYLTTVNPIIYTFDSLWNKLNYTLTYYDTISLSNKEHIVQIPVFELNANISIIGIERPWFKPVYLSKSKENNIAVIDKLILSNDISIKNFQKSTITFQYNRKQHKAFIKTIKSNETIKGTNSQIVGYILKVY